MQIKWRNSTAQPSEKHVERAALAVYNVKATVDQIYTYFWKERQGTLILWSIKVPSYELNIVFFYTNP